MAAARRRGVTARRRRSPTCGERQACRTLRTGAGPAPAGSRTSIPEPQRTPDVAQRAAVQLDGVACDDQTVTAARLPGARAHVEERPASGRAPRSSTQTDDRG